MSSGMSTILDRSLRVYQETAVMAPPMQCWQASSSQGSGRMADFKSLAEDSQSLVRDFVKTQGQREEDMLLKVKLYSAVLQRGFSYNKAHSLSAVNYACG